MAETHNTKQLYFDNNTKEETNDASFETDLSFSSDIPISSQAKLIRPKASEHLFHFPIGLQEKYQKIFQEVEKIIEELQDKINFVSVRDDCSIKPKSVTLVMPIRKKTH